MKILTLLIAAMLLLFFIACNNTRNETNAQEYSSPRGSQPNTTTIRDVTQTPIEPLQTQSGKFTTPIVVEDEEVMQPPVSIERAEEEMRRVENDEYAPITENRFLRASDNPLSTFSIDVDEASYSNVRRYLQSGNLPPAGAVRIEELINYFDYDYPQPVDGQPFSINTEIGACPWNPEHQLVHVGLQGRKIPIDHLPGANFVFLIDVSGSMDEPDKLPLVQSAMQLLTDKLRTIDRVAIVVYAGSAVLVLPSTTGDLKSSIKTAISTLEADGSTAGGEGIQLAYRIARENFIAGGNNRIILATDGDFNVGPSSDDEMVRLIETERRSGVFLSVLGVGMGNYQDGKMQLIADKGNGNHSYIDNINEAKKVLVNEFESTLFTIAKDVKIQVEFNPARVQAYRLIGYENRLLSKEDFNDDSIDAGELGAGHTVTALYEIIPVGIQNNFTRTVDSLKYSPVVNLTANPTSDEWMTIKLRYKEPNSEKSRLTSHVLRTTTMDDQLSDNFRFSAAVAEFGLLLRNSAFKQGSTFSAATKLAQAGLGKDRFGYRAEFIELVSTAGTMATR